MASPIRLVASWVSLPSINYNAVDNKFYWIKGFSLFSLRQLQLHIWSKTVTFASGLNVSGNGSSETLNDKPFFFLYLPTDFAPNIIFLKSLEESGTVKEKDKLLMRCRARSFPLSNITWIHNGAKMSVCLKIRSQDCMGKSYKVQQYTNEQWLTSISQLIIESTSFPRDNGTYTCVARNSKSYDEKNLEISIESMCYKNHM